jgi:hypothetical protein
MVDFKTSGYTFNITKFRGSPTEATTLSGHHVEKQEYVYFKIPDEAQLGNLMGGEWMYLKCADYHMEHFIYIDPVFLQEGPEAQGHWFAMCTCGSPAVILDQAATEMHDTLEDKNLLACYHYMLTKSNYGHGWHVGQDKREWT